MLSRCERGTSVNVCRAVLHRVNASPDGRRESCLLGCATSEMRSGRWVRTKSGTGCVAWERPLQAQKRRGSAESAVERLDRAKLWTSWRRGEAQPLNSRTEPKCTTAPSAISPLSGRERAGAVAASSALTSPHFELDHAMGSRGPFN